MNGKSSGIVIPVPLTLTAAADDDGRRLDRLLRKALRDLPLSAIHRLLRQGRIRVNGETAAPARRVRAGETITIEESHGKTTAPSPPRFAPSALPPRREPKVQCEKRSGTVLQKAEGNLEILFEGSGLLVLNKPAGLAVHGGDGSNAPHLAGQVLSWLAPKLPPSLSFKPGPLHRLDKPSSGVIAFSTNIQGARLFSAMMRERTIKKLYLALVQGSITEAETWQDELSRDRDMKKTFAGGQHGGKRQTAVTKVRPLAQNAGCTLLLAEIETGRPHQIRAQAAARGHPLLGDTKYGARSSPNGGFLLHAWRMEFPADAPLPALPERIEAPLPEYFSAKIRELFGGDALQFISG